MPVTFPDGSTAEIVYAPGLELESAVITPNWAGAVMIGEDGASSDFLVRHASLKEWVAATFAKLKSTESGANGTTVCVYSFNATLGPSHPDYLVYRFGHWIVGVHSADAMTPKVRRAWAAGLTGSVQSDGFLVLGSTGGVKFTARGQPHGPQLDLFRDRSGVTLHLGACTPEVRANNPDFEDGSACLPGTDVFAVAGAFNGFTAREVLQGLEMRNVVLAAR